MITSPKLFLSYSWSSPALEQWVLTLATELRESGVDVILDKWELREGNDANAFMEKMVTDPTITKVVMICDRVYAEKADGRSGGVGTETQIISPEVYNKQEQTKFVAVLPERDESDKPFLPTYYKSRVYIDLSSAEMYGRNFEKLLRWAFDKPLHVKPDVGEPPEFLQSQDAPRLSTAALCRRAIDAIRECRPYCAGAVKEYFDVFSCNLENFRMAKDTMEFDEKVVTSIEQFRPYRDEAISVFVALAKYRNTEDSWASIHKLFESLFQYLERPESVAHYQQEGRDNFRFIVHELFLSAVATFLRFECFSAVAHLVQQEYYFGNNAGRGKDAMMSFSEIGHHLESLEHRNKRLNLNRLSLHADILSERFEHGDLTFTQIMQADFVLFMRDVFDCSRNGSWQDWFPTTLLYSERHFGAFEIFARSKSKRYFEKVCLIFESATKEDLMPLVESLKNGKLQVPRWGFHSFDATVLMGFDKIASSP